MKRPFDNPKIIILEDDPDQMAFLSDLVEAEVDQYIKNEQPNKIQTESLKKTQLIRVSNVSSLRKALSLHKDIAFAILDCNTPDTSDGKAHDQLLKTNHKITGQHKAVDTVMKYIPNTPVLLTSSLNRFRRIIYQYYVKNHALDILFVRKANPDKLSRNIKRLLEQYLNETESKA